MFFMSVFTCCCVAQEDEHFNDDKTLYDSGYALFKFYEDFEIDEKINNYDTVTDIENELRNNTIKLKEALLEQALDYFDKVIEKHPESKYYISALYNKAGAEYILGYNTAKISYLSLINSVKVENDSLNKSFILPSIYFLAELECKDKNYTKSLEYIAILDKNPRFPIGSDLYYVEMADHAYMAGKNYINLGDNQKALEAMLPYIIGPEHMYSEHLVRQTAQLIKNKYGRQQANKLFEKAISKIYFNKEGPRKYYYIKFLDTDIEIYYTPKIGVVDGSQTAEIERNISRSNFKRLINGNLL